MFILLEVCLYPISSVILLSYLPRQYRIYILFWLKKCRFVGHILCFGHFECRLLKYRWCRVQVEANKSVESTFSQNLPSPSPPNRTNRTLLLGLSPSLLGGGTAGFPQLPPGPGQQLTRTPEHNPDVSALYLPLAGWRAHPALSAMQEPIPDFSQLLEPKSEQFFRGVPRGVKNVSNIDSNLALWFFPLFNTIINSTKHFRHLAYQEHPPLATPFRTQKYKGFSKFIKEKIV